MRPLTYVALLLLLLMQLFIRVHNITLLPVFIDEDNHLRRSAAFRHLEQNPAQESHGKFLLYIWLAQADLKDRDTALHLGRTLVALSSLLSSALIFALLRKTPILALWAVAVYALLPYAFFYERMALADPLAGTMGLLTLWASLALAKKPSYRRGVLVGIAAALTVAAKLTMAFAVGFPVLALLAFQPFSRLRQNFPYLLAAGLTFVFLWIPILIPARLSLMNDSSADDYILVNTELVQEDSSSLGQKTEEVWTKFSTMSSLPFALAAVGILALGLYQQPRRVAFLLGCLLLAWLPSVLIVQNLQTRYLMSGLPILVLILGTGLASLPRRFDAWVGLAILLWAGLFALPFARTLLTHPPEVNVPPLDAKNYFWDRYNAYGEREALAFLQANGERFENRVLVLPLTKVCRQLDLHAQPNVTPVCIAGYAETEWEKIGWRAYAMPFLKAGVPVYVMTNEQSDPLSDSEIVWEWFGVFPKPFEIQQVRIWRLHHFPQG